MFGVDSEGRDKLAKINRPLKLGSVMDMDVMQRDYYEFYSNDPQSKETALKEALFELYKESIIQLSNQDIEEARMQIINLGMDSFNEKLESHHEDKRLFTSQNAPAMNEARATTQYGVQRVFDENAKKSNRQKLEQKIAHDSEEVILLALDTAYKRGEFMGMQSQINKEKDLIIQRWAIESAYEDTKERGTLASRSAVLSTALS